MVTTFYMNDDLLSFLDDVADSTNLSRAKALSLVLKIAQDNFGTTGIRNLYKDIYMDDDIFRRAPRRNKTDE